MTPTLETLSEDQNLHIKCEVRKCGVEVINCDDYTDHLRIEHNMTVGISHFLKRFQDKIKQEIGGKRKAVEMVELSDDEEEISDIEMENEEESDNARLKEMMSRVIRKKLQPLHDIIEENNEVSKVTDRFSDKNKVTHDEDELMEELLDNLSKAFRKM